MAKTWIRATKQFTRRIGANTIVGHPKHPEANGRVAEVDEGEALNKLVSGGYAKRISQAEYRRELEGSTALAGDNRVAQTAGQAPRASITMTDGQLDAMAAERGVTFSEKDSRADRVKKINAKKVDVSAELPDPETDKWAQSGLDTTNSTNHPQRSGTQSDVTDEGTTDRLGFGYSGIRSAEGEDVSDADDAAPTGSTAASKASGGSRSRSSGSRSSGGSKPKPAAPASGSSSSGGSTGTGTGEGSGGGSSTDK